MGGIYTAARNGKFPLWRGLGGVFLLNGFLVNRWAAFEIPPNIFIAHGFNRGLCVHLGNLQWF